MIHVCDERLELFGCDKPELSHTYHFERLLDDVSRDTVENVTKMVGSSNIFWLIDFQQ